MKQVNGIYLPEYDTHFEKHLLKGPLFEGKGTYQYNKIEAALKECKIRSVALDIGAHVGLWSRVLCRHFAHVIAFEPVPIHRMCFDANLGEAANWKAGGNVCLHPDALGRDERLIHINPTPGNSGNAHVDLMKMEGAELIEVQQRPLDYYQLKNISFIKIDVEGYELEVIKGGEQTIREQKPVMVVEQKPGNARKYGFKDTEAIILLQKWGARVVWNMGGDYCLRFE